MEARPLKHHRGAGHALGARAALEPSLQPLVRPVSMPPPVRTGGMRRSDVAHCRQPLLSNP
jgi:hypothetical protein